MLRTTLAALMLSACHAPPPAQPQGGISKVRAVGIAIDTGRAGGYEPALYDLKSVDFETDAGSFQNMWRVHFELKPPGRPGGFFTVYVARDGTPQLFYGR